LREVSLNALSILTEPRAALAVRVAASAMAVALGCTEGRADAAQTKDATNGGGCNGFERLAA
jgi:hypothetical protein